ncbi:hypothetical protein BU26DRAFT_38497 [Trematosphaeria pertusa]|uniref:Uncharacterized protein n=1 Tax=Trematosphaeria pertusa TaxID=390896 RepID=A0A6A6J4B8_9PLEO|nr:uncharacterized protein BU26DRAFT_38497 [Trematosphaeria pertusa]KAF2257207.1 hypothetical protein BU26DRAFT_38497 [Trematosphaeria pertusa]
MFQSSRGACSVVATPSVDLGMPWSSDLLKLCTPCSAKSKLKYAGWYAYQPHVFIEISARHVLSNQRIVFGWRDFRKRRDISANPVEFHPHLGSGRFWL